VISSDEKALAKPVILDTDIGGDMDDTWALVLLLLCPELDVKLIVSATGDTTYRAKIVARLLEVAGRTDIPVGIGMPQGKRSHPNHWKPGPWIFSQAAWVENYNLQKYPGTLHTDGIAAMVETIMASPEVVTLISIGPLSNIAEALEREPAIAPKCRFVGMHGSIRASWCKKGQIAETNVAGDIAASKMVFTAPWRDMIITPTDSCAKVGLRDKNYQAILQSEKPLLRAMIENYRVWAQWTPQRKESFPHSSSGLCDTVAIYLAFSTEWLAMERMGIRISDDGYTNPDANAKIMDVAMDWKDLPAFESFLTQRLMT